MRYELDEIVAAVAVFMLGLVFGSFATLASHRLPLRDQVVRGRSRCTSCDKILAACDLIPLFSWFFQGGRCRYCDAPISLRYPLIEFATALAFTAAFLYAGFSLLTVLLGACALALIVGVVIVLERPRGLHAALVLSVAFVLASCAIPAPHDMSNGAKDAWNAPRKRMGSHIDITERDKIDPNKDLTRQDYKDTFYTPPVPDIKPPSKDLMLPDVSQLMAEPKIPIVGSDKLVTISVTGDVPLKDVLMELARRADIDIEIDPGVEGGVIFRTKDRPFSEVIERVSDLAGLRYSVKNGVLRVERDTPYIENYNVDFLNVTRTSTSAVNITSTLLGGGSGTEGGSNISSGSQAALNASSGIGDMWGIVEQGIFNILQSYRAFVEPDEEEVAAAGRSQRFSSDNAEEAAPGTEGAQTSLSVRPIVQKADRSAILSMNRQAGVITVLGTKKQHDAIRKYLDQVSRTQSAQVLIEAKIVEVSLDDQYRSGIDWSFINGRVTPLTARGNFTDFGDLNPASTDLFSVIFDPAEIFGFDDTSLEATLQLVEQFGTGRTISSPRINAMNNQFAVLTFAENFVYFQLTVQEDQQQQDTSTDTTLTVQSEIKTVPIGVILALQPSINLERNEITMNLRPTLSRITGQVSDPGVSIIAQRAGVDNIQSNVPVVEVRELDSVLKMKSGQVMVIGGLMQERSNNTDKGVPGLAGVPVLGKAFKSTQKDNEVVETVIFIKATIMPTSGTVSPEDKEFYRKFGRTRSSASL